MTTFAKTIPAIFLLLVGCGEITTVPDPDPTTARRGTDALVPVTGAGGAIGGPVSGAGGAVTNGAGGATAIPAYSCAAVPLPPPPATSDRPYVFLNFGGACTRGGGECLAAEATGAPAAFGTPHFAESCTADPPDPAAGTEPALPGPGFCSSVLPARQWDTSCHVLNANQIPTGWHCCSSATAPAVLLPGNCGCPL